MPRISGPCNSRGGSSARSITLALSAALCLVMSVSCGTDEEAGDAAGADATGTDSAGHDVAADGRTDEDTTPPHDGSADTEGDDTQADTATDGSSGDDAATLPPCVDDPAGFDAAQPLEFPIDGQAIVLGTRDEQRGIRYVIDTGAQITSYDFDLTDGSAGFFNVERLDLGSTVLCDISGKGRDLSEAEAYIGVDIDALLGQTALKQLYTYIGYREGSAWFFQTDPSNPPPGMDGVEPVDFPYELQNELPVAEVGLAPDVAGDLLADTGSGVTIVVQSLFDAVEEAHDGELPRLDGYVWATNYGTDESFITRLPRLELGEAVVENEWAVVIPDDHHVRALFEGAGIDVDGFLGYPAYRYFLWEVRGPETSYRLWTYDSTEHIPEDEWVRVGIELIKREGAPIVEMIFSPSDAETADIERGDELLAIDGDTVVDQPLDATRRLMRGAADETRTLTLRRATRGETFDVDVLVEDLLPR